MLNSVKINYLSERGIIGSTHGATTVPQIGSIISYNMIDGPRVSWRIRGRVLEITHEISEYLREGGFDEVINVWVEQPEEPEIIRHGDENGNGSQ